MEILENLSYYERYAAKIVGPVDAIEVVTRVLPKIMDKPPAFAHTCVRNAAIDMKRRRAGALTLSIAPDFDVPAESRARQPLYNCDELSIEQLTALVNYLKNKSQAPRFAQNGRYAEQLRARLSRVLERDNHV